MARSTSTDPGVRYDLPSIERELRGEAGYLREGHTARTLLRQQDLRVMLIAIRAGARIPEHATDDTTSIQVLSGRVRLRPGGQVVDLDAGQLLVLERGLPHDVEAEVDSALVVTMGWHSR